MDSRFQAGEGAALSRYFAEIRRHPLLTAEEEQRLARAYRAGDRSAGHRLVLSNLRFVVKIANRYRSGGIRMADLIQEGNIGLMKAVGRFDPDRGLRLVTYAAWWIRACIQDHVIGSFSLVRVGTTRAQRLLFFSLRRIERELASRGAAALVAGADPFSRLAARLGVKREDVEEMHLRLSGRDVRLDAPMGEERESTRLDHLPFPGPAQDHELAAAQARSLVARQVGEALAALGPRERLILEERVMSDRPLTLTELGERLGISGERARQLERRAKATLRRKLDALAIAIGWAGAAPGQEPGADAASAA